MNSFNDLIDGIRACGYECEAGPLENNVDYQKLVKLAHLGATVNDLVAGYLVSDGIKERMNELRRTGRVPGIPGDDGSARKGAAALQRKRDFSRLPQSGDAPGQGQEGQADPV